MNQPDPTSPQFWSAERLEDYPQLNELFHFVEGISSSFPLRLSLCRFDDWAPEVRDTVFELRAQYFLSKLEAQDIMGILCLRFDVLHKAATIAIKYPKGYKRRPYEIPPWRRTRFELLKRSLRLAGLPQE